MNSIITKDATQLAQENYTEYSKYVAQGRSYPCIYDGAKSSYKRAIYGMHKNNKHQMVKVAELASYALPYHPHPTSISGVIVALGDGGNKLKLMETQGNWGNSAINVSPSADRYIGGYLSDLSESLLCDSIDYCRTIKGEIDKDEPEALPALLPLCFINGLKGIPSGLPTLNIPTLDIDGMLNYYIDILEHKDINYKPKKYPMPNIETNVLSKVSEWNDIMSTGKGSLKIAPIMEITDNTITITSLTGSKDIESVRKILAKEIALEKVDVTDESTSRKCIVVEKVPYKQINMKDVYNTLYKKLQCAESYNMAFFDLEKIYVPCSFDKVVKANLQYIIDTHNNRINNQLADLQAKLKVLEIINDIKISNKVKDLAILTTEDAYLYVMKKYSTTRDIAVKVFQKPLSYLTKEHQSELDELKVKIEQLTKDNSDIYEFLLNKYKCIKKDIDKIIKGKFLPTKFI